MADVFNDGDKITSEFLNKVSKTVTDGCGDKTTPTDVRLFIGAEKEGAAGTVQTDLDSHKADSNIHFEDAPNNTKDYVRGEGKWKEAALTEAPMNGDTFGRRNGVWSAVSGTGASDHQALANLEAADAHPISSITGLTEKNNAYDSHLANILNPHLVTAEQVGATTPDDVDAKIQTHLTTAPHIPDVTEAGKQFTRTTNGWEEAAGANVVEYSLITATSAGNVEEDLDATDFTGHPYAGANTYVTVETNHVVTVAHGADLYKYIGAKPKNLGLNGDATTNADYLQSGSSDHSALTNRDAVDSHPTSAIEGLDDALSGKSDTSHLHTGVYDPAGTGQAAADVVQGNLDTHAGNGSMHIGHATNDGNPYVSFEGAWALLDDHITPPAVETDHTRMTNRDQPNQHSIGSVGISGGVQLQDEIDRIDAEVALKANQAALVAHAGDATIHFADVTESGKQFARTTTGWVEVSAAGAGDLRSDGSVPMAGSYSPALEQDLATKSYADLVFQGRLAGYDTNGDTLDLVTTTGITDFDLIDFNSQFAYLAGGVTNEPPQADARSIVVTRVWDNSNRISQMVYPTGSSNTGIWMRMRNSTWTEWFHIADSRYAPFTPEGDLTSTTVQDAIVEASTIGGSSDSTIENTVDVTGNHTVSESDLGKVLRCIGDGATYTITIPNGMTEDGIFSIIHEGGADLHINVAATSINGSTQLTDILNYGSGLYLAHSNTSGADAWSATGGRNSVAVPIEEVVQIQQGDTYQITDSDLGKRLTCVGNAATTTIQIPEGITAAGKFTISHAGGTSLIVNVEGLNTVTLNGGVQLLTDVLDYDGIVYLGHGDGDGWQMLDHMGNRRTIVDSGTTLPVDTSGYLEGSVFIVTES